MTRRLALGVAVLALALPSCSDDDESPQEPTPPKTVETPGAAGQFPPAFVRCMADQGVDIEQPSDIHSSPQAFQACLRFLH